MQQIPSNKINFCLAETHKHVRTVQKFLNIFIHDLINRGQNHDSSKFEEPELSLFAEQTGKLGQTPYGGEEYKKLLEEVRPAIRHHYSRNDHHPEFHKNGIDDMDLIQLCELIVDWRAASERNKDGNIRRSIDINAQKYDISPQLKRILENTVKKYFKE